ncbi:hypothetical protein pb186bvf_004395 [Paramecium bursaria]
METTLSHQIKDLNQKNLEMQSLENRINQLRQQQKLKESYNNVMQKKIEKILYAKKNAKFDQLEIEKRRHYLSQDDHGQINQIKMVRKMQQEEARRNKEDLEEEKKLRTALTKEKMEFTLIKMKQRRDNELEEKRIQYQRISEWEYNLKQDLETKKLEKIDKIRKSQSEIKQGLAYRIAQQQQHYERMVEEEQRLLSKLQNTQKKGDSIKQDLMTAMNLSLKDYNSIVGSTSSVAKSRSQIQMTKEQLRSPYAQIPIILKQKYSKSPLNQQTFREQVLKEYQYSLPTLSKPSYSEQMEHVDRLYKPKQKHTKEFSQLISLQSQSLNEAKPIEKKSLSKFTPNKQKSAHNEVKKVPIKEEPKKQPKDQDKEEDYEQEQEYENDNENGENNQQQSKQQEQEQEQPPQKQEDNQEQEEDEEYPQDQEQE